MSSLISHLLLSRLNNKEYSKLYELVITNCDDIPPLGNGYLKMKNLITLINNGMRF